MSTKKKTSNKVPEYEILPSDGDEWLIIQLKNSKIRVDFQKIILGLRYDCIPHPVSAVGSEGEPSSCSRFCCYAGCYISPIEIKFIESILPDLKKKYLPKDSLEVLKKRNDEFYIPEDYDPEEDLYKTRCAPQELQPCNTETEENGDDDENQTEKEGTIAEQSDETEDENSEVNETENSEEESSESNEQAEDKESESIEDSVLTYEDKIPEIPPQHCLFLMDDGLCSVHKYCVEHDLDWHQYKFNICTTFPMDLRVTRNDTSKDAVWPLQKRVDDECSTAKMMEDYETFFHCKMDCINLSPKVKKEKDVPFILDSMKYAFVSRYGEDLWNALNDYAVKYRKENNIL